MKYRFTRFWSVVLMVVGAVILGACTVAAVGVLVESVRVPVAAPVEESRSRLIAAVVVAVLGLVVGGACIAAGQALRILVDQRRLLARIHAQLRRRREQSEEGLPGRDIRRNWPRR